MDSQPSGNRCDIFIKTPKLDFKIDYSRAKRESFKGDESLKYSLRGEDMDVPGEHSGFIFQEYTDYNIMINADPDIEIDIYHENMFIRESFQRNNQRGCNIIHGRINFRGDIGKTSFIVNVQGEEYLRIQGEVFPSKIDYKDDYASLLHDVSQEMYNLAYDFLKRTYLPTGIKNKKGESPNEFYSILCYVFQEFTKSIDIILRQPHHQLLRERTMEMAHKVKTPGGDTMRWIQRRGITKRIPSVKKEVTYDTKENRFLKYIICDIRKRLEEFSRIYNPRDKNKTGWERKIDPMVIDQVKTMEGRLKRYTNTSFLKDVGDMRFTQGSISQVFTMGMGYRDIYKYYLMLQKGLSLEGDIFRLSMKDLSVLYEYWCFIKINAILRKRYKVRSADFLKVNRNGLFVTLRKGNESKVVYEDGDDTFTIAYNSQRKTRTTLQKPDNIFSIRKETNQTSVGTVHEFVFDAKYKIDTSVDYKKKYNTPGPKEEDINTMHRYRDALRYQTWAVQSGTVNKNDIIEALILFPYGDENEYRQHHFFASIEEVGIGGLPFLPSATGEVEKVLERMIK